MSQLGPSVRGGECQGGRICSGLMTSVTVTPHTSTGAGLGSLSFFSRRTCSPGRRKACLHLSGLAGNFWWHRPASPDGSQTSQSSGEQRRPSVIGSLSRRLIRSRADFLTVRWRSVVPTLSDDEADGIGAAELTGGAWMDGCTHGRMGPC